MMYLAHFGLQQPPYRNTPDSRFFFAGGERGPILEALIYAIAQGEGIVKVVGEVGSGKTMLCRALERHLSGSVEIVYLANPSLDPENILYAIAVELKLSLDGLQNRFEVLQLIQRRLLELHAVNQQVVVLVEEAQAMPLSTLEEIRLLSNLETQQEKLLQIVLFGQPELDVHLVDGSIRQLNERIAHRLYLSPLSRQVIGEYLNHRLYKAGYRGPELFGIRAVKMLSFYSKGAIRRINFLADKALLAAYADNALKISKNHLRRAAADCDFIKTGVFRQWIRPQQVIALVLAGGIVIGLSFFMAENLKQRHERVPSIADAEITKPLPRVILLDPEPEAHALINDHHQQLEDPPYQSVTQERLHQTKKWMLEVDKSQYTIQLMTSYADNEEQVNELERVLQQEEVQSNLGQIWLYQGMKRGKPVFVVSFSQFSNVSRARAKIEDLPIKLRRYKPFVRTIRSLRNEIAIDDVSQTKRKVMRGHV